MVFLKIKKFFKHFWKKILLILGASSIAIAAVAVPITCTYQIQQTTSSNSSVQSFASNDSSLSTNFNAKGKVHGLNPDLSTKWVNNSKGSNYVQSSFTSLENYKLNQQNNFVALVQTANGINSKQIKEKEAFDAHLAKTAKIISHLSTSQKNQLKNAMLKMYNDVKNKKVSTKNIADVIGQITNKKYQNDVSQYLVNLKQKENNANKETNKVDDTSLFVSSNNDLNLYATNNTVGNRIETIDECVTAFSTLAVAAGVFSIAMFAIAWLTFGSSTTWAVAASIAAAALAGVAASLGIYNDTLKADANQAPQGWNCAFTTFVSIFSLGSLVYKIIAACAAIGATVSATSWAFPAICVVLGMASVITSLFEY